MARNSATVKIKGKEDVSKAAGKAGKSIKQLRDEADKSNKSTKSFGSQIKAFSGGLMAASAAAIAVGVALKKAFDLGELGAKINQTQQAFTNMAAAAGEDADAIMRSLQEMTRGTVSEMDLMASASRAAVLGLPIDELDRLMQIAMASARATGESTTKMFSDIVLGLGRQSKMILDNLGILVNVEEANAKYAATLGKVAAELDDAERKQAFLNATLEAGESIVERVGLDMENLTDAQKFDAMKAAFKDLKSELATGLTPAMSALAEWIGDVARETAEWVKEINNLREVRSKLLGGGIVSREEATGVLESKIKELQEQLAGGRLPAGVPAPAGAQAQMIKDLVAYHERLLRVLTSTVGVAAELEDSEGRQAALVKQALDVAAKIKSEEAETLRIVALRGERLDQIDAIIQSSFTPLEKQVLALLDQRSVLQEIMREWNSADQVYKTAERALEGVNTEMDKLLKTTEKQMSLWAKYGPLITKIWKSGGGTPDYGAGTWSQGAGEQINTDMSGVVWGAGDMGFASIMETSVTDFFSGGGFDFGAIVQDAFTQGMPEGMELSDELQQQADNLGTFGNALLDTTIAASGLAGRFIENIIAMGPIGALYTLLVPVIEGLFSVLKPAIDTVLVPLFSALFSIGQVIGVLLTPIFNALAPIMHALLTGIMALIEPISMVLAPIMDALGWVLKTIVVPVIKVFASLLIGLSGPIQLLADVFNFIGDTLKTLGHNIEAFFTVGMEAKEYKTYEETGGRTWAEIWADVEAKQAELWAQGTGGGNQVGGGTTTDTLEGLWDGFDWENFTFPGIDPYDGGGYDGGPESHTTVQHAPDVYVYITVQGNVIGEGGAVQVGEYVAGAIGELIGTGARVEWLEAE